ncbi:MAG: SDR family oxidoreductase [Deltaproteobacteria bacterium]|nr:SDR family oxidoreductase [Deltaproteobacteria bacterium]
MGVLDGKTVFVAGGAGNIGGALVRGALRAGAARVLTCSRDTARFERLRRFVADAGFMDGDRLVTLQGDLGSMEGARAVFDAVVAQAGVPDTVMASLGGGMAPATLLGTPAATWYGVLRSNLSSHFHAAQTFLPAMVERRSGAYLVVCGHAADTPTPEGGAVGAASAAVLMLARTLHVENRRSGVRVRPVVLITAPELWATLQGTPGAHRGDDVGEFMARLGGGDDAGMDGEVIRYVTDWASANAMLRA